MEEVKDPKNKKNIVWIILTIILALALIGGTVFYFWQANKTKKDKEQLNKQIQELNKKIDELNKAKTQSTTTTTTTTITDVTANWKTYTGRGITFKYPADYYVDDKAQNVVEVYSIKPGEQSRCATQGSQVPKCEVKISIPLDGNTPVYYPQDSDLKQTAEQIINTIKKL